MTGGDIGQGAAMGAAGWAAGEAANMMIGRTLGSIMSGGDRKFENGVAYYCAKGRTPFSVGGVVIGDEGLIKEWRVHELAHATGKQKNLGPAYIPAHVLSQGFSWLIGTFTGATYKTHRYNIFERWWIEEPAF